MSAEQSSRYTQESIYPPIAELLNPENIDVYTFLFEHSSPFDDQSKAEALSVLTDPYPGSHPTNGTPQSRSWTFPELKKRAELCGRMLVNPKWGFDLKKGEVVGILGWNGFGFAEIEYGTLWAYGTAHTKILAVHSRLLFSLGLPACQRIGVPLHCITLLDLEYPTSYISSNLERHPEFNVSCDHRFYTMDELLLMQSQFEESCPLGAIPRRKIPNEVRLKAASDVALLCCTSGTTGNPKAVMLSHKNVIVNILQSCGRPCDRTDGEKLAGERYISLPPWFHQGGQQYGMTVALYKRMENVMMETIDVVKLVDLIKRFKPREFILYPFLADKLSNSPLSHDISPSMLSSLRSVIVGGATVPASTIRAWYHKFPDVPFRQAMGATETTAVAMMQSFEDYKDTVGGCGRLVPGMKAKLLVLSKSGSVSAAKRMQESQVITKDDTPGELYLSGPNIMLGYLNNPKATEEVLYCTTNPYGEEEAWYKTGDFVITKNNGVDFFHLGRIKDLIWHKTDSVKDEGGYRVIRPAEIENIIGQHNSVKECAVIGVPDQTHESVPKAFVVLFSDPTRVAVNRENLRRELLEFANLRMDDDMRLRGGLEFIDYLPKNISGKILRNQLPQSQPS
ncbi:hypothetical protein BDZ91DRAFT_759744 [Kalaharituber pfeilii]|nr:hypothetical protein BDZ91DRAFT_759744 [Kalaharituber pfeilii]